jgi:hypothetical protein
MDLSEEETLEGHPSRLLHATISLGKSFSAFLEHIYDTLPHTPLTPARCLSAMSKKVLPNI